MATPNNPFTLMFQVYRKIIPVVHLELNKWRALADKIPNPELRKQALASLEQKTFHCEGGAILALLANAHCKDCVRFIVAYQTISDYLDNLCDRSTSQDPKDFAALHEAMLHALMPDKETSHYYRFREEQDDDGYLEALVQTCRDVLKNVQHFQKIQPHLIQLAELYCDLQVYKHIANEQRVARLEEWFKAHKEDFPMMTWYEFSACAGSTLGIFCLVPYASRKIFSQTEVSLILKGYFPYLQGLHILLDYFIDQDEDRCGGDLNFCSFYESEKQILIRLNHFIAESNQQTCQMPDRNFHRYIIQGLLAVYLSDSKVLKQPHVNLIAEQLISSTTLSGKFLYWNAKKFRQIKSTPRRAVSTKLLLGK